MSKTIERDLISEDFGSIEAAVDFWDTHSVADYWDLMEDVELEFDVKGHISLVQIREDIYPQTRALAKANRQSVEEFVNQLIVREVEKLPA